MLMKKQPLFWQVFLAALLIIFTSVAATTWLGTRMIRSFYFQQLEEDIMDRALLLRPHINMLLSGNHEQLQEFCRENGRAAATRITVIAHDGKVLADSNENPEVMDNHAARPEVKKALTGQPGASLRLSKTLAQNMFYVALPLEDGPLSGVLRLAIPATAIETVLSSIHRKIILGAFVISLVSALMSYYFAQRLSKPLEEMRRGTELLAAGKTDQVFIMRDTHVSREMADLAQSLNDMAEQVNSRIKLIIQQRNELEAVFTSMTDGMLAISSDHNIIRLNKTAADFFLIDGHAVKGKPFEGVIRNRALQEFLTRSLTTEGTSDKIVTLTESGQPLTLRVQAVPLYDGDAQRMGSLVIMHNLTRINQLENIRQDFVANVSHELKTPITAIRGYVETLLDGALDSPEEAKNFLQIIHKQGARLDAIVDDLLTLARIEDKAKKNELRLQREKICPILEAAVQTCSVHAEQKDVHLEVQCGPDLECLANRPMLEQAIINLLSNAITYSPVGGLVHLWARQEITTEGRDVVRISIRDQGPGIASEHQERIFERFYRVDKARSREHGGTGLGLSIVKHIAGSHNGTVKVQSSLGHGSTFTLTLPLKG